MIVSQEQYQQQLLAELRNYPEAIALTKNEILESNEIIRIYTEKKTELDNLIAEQVLADTTLKNDRLRKLAATKLEQGNTYVLVKDRLQAEKRKKENLQLKLENLEDEFTVVKIELRLITAKLNAIAPMI